MIGRAIESRLDAIEARLSAIEARFGTLEATCERRFGEQSRWLVAMWITIVGAAIALWFRH